MSHYICKGEDCTTLSDQPGLCLESVCLNRYKLLEECNCPHKSEHESYISIPKKTGLLNVKNFGVAFGITIGLFLFLLGVLSYSSGGWGADLVKIMSVLYIGYDSTLIGSLAGGLWGFLDGFLCGAIMAWIYNYLQRKSR